jgi:Cellulase (glycosyl hydrolase family 5)
MSLSVAVNARSRKPAASGRRVWLLAPLLAMLAMTLPAPAPAQAAVAGVNIASPAPAQIGAARSLGGKWVRLFVSWRGMEPVRGQISAAALGSYEQGLAGLPAGSKVILDVYGTPQWESGSTDEHAPPANPQDYAEFVAALAHRLAPWVTAYEIWNEEDAPIWWTGAPDPAGYVRLLQAAYPAIKTADPRATVVLGGLTGNDFPFLEGVYAAGGKGYFDAVGVHTDTACNVLSPYTFLRGTDDRIIPDSFLAYREVHATMLANGDDKPIWMTEMSWRTSSAICSEGVWAGQKPQGVSDQEQATFLSQAYHCLAENPYVQVALWYPLQDEGAVTSGLTRADGSQKPSYAAMRAYIRDGDRLKEPCGNFTGPKIDIASPSNHKVYSGPLPIHVSARSSQGVFRIRLEIDGKLIRNYDGPSDPSYLAGRITWQGAKHISFGRHTLTFLAYDKERNISRRSITIIHTKPKPRRRHHH